jgi:hypothetical protein
MNLENECVKKQSERLFELFFSLITGSVGGFFVFIFIWQLNGLINNHRSNGSKIVLLSILLLIAYWFLKLTYKLVFNKSKYLLSVTELRITGWFFILAPVGESVLYLANGQGEELMKYMLPTLPGCIYGYYALKAATNRKTESNHVDIRDPKPVRSEPTPF